MVDIRANKMLENVQIMRQNVTRRKAARINIEKRENAQDGRVMESRRKA
jgi:hypothetical protein